jgi:hypothetical protein
LKGKEFSQTPMDYKSIELDYKLLQGDYKSEGFQMQDLPKGLQHH